MKTRETELYTDDVPVWFGIDIELTPAEWYAVQHSQEWAALEAFIDKLHEKLTGEVRGK